MERSVLFFDIDGTVLSEITRQVPESAVRALAMHSPKVMVNVGLIEEALTISRLSPVARMESAVFVHRSNNSATPASTVIIPASTSSYQSPPIPVVRKSVKAVS